MQQVSLGDMALGARAKCLAEIVSKTSVTSRDGKPMDTETAVADIVSLLRQLRGRQGSVYIAGNGGSAAVAGHCAVDFLNVAGLRASTLHESSMMTCMANDYGYENVFARMLSMLAQPNDLLITISSSGRSSNILNAAAKMRALDGRVITLSGFASDNPLRSLGDINFWLDSRDYGMVEIGHQFLLHNLSDRLIPGPPKD